MVSHAFHYPYSLSANNSQINCLALVERWLPLATICYNKPLVFPSYVHSSLFSHNHLIEKWRVLMIYNCLRPLKIVLEEKWRLLQELETCLVTIANKGCYLCSTLFVETNVRCGYKISILTLKIGDGTYCEGIWKGVAGSNERYVHPVKCFLMWAEYRLPISMSLVLGKQSSLQGDYLSPFYDA